MHCNSVNVLTRNHSDQQVQISSKCTMLTTTTIESTSTPLIKSATPTGDHLAIESIMPRIYLAKNFIVWNKENLLAHGFTHIIIIDKHIQQLYYPSPTGKLSPRADADIDHHTKADLTCNAISQFNFGNGFETIDLNFGEKSYLTTVLPNCYRAVKFINKALQANGTLLVIDCNGGEQKCLTIIVAYLMYKNNINFNDAFLQLKEYYKKADLDRFYTSQLYEYEPILQVQRAHSRGHSCSRELHSALLKRKKTDDQTTDDLYNTSANDFLHTLNPLTQFHTHQQQAMTTSTDKYIQLQPSNDESAHPSVYPNNFHDWYDYVME